VEGEVNDLDNCQNSRRRGVLAAIPIAAGGYSRLTRLRIPPARPIVLPAPPPGGSASGAGATGPAGGVTWRVLQPERLQRLVQLVQRRCRRRRWRRRRRLNRRPTVGPALRAAASGVVARRRHPFARWQARDPAGRTAARLEV